MMQKLLLFCLVAPMAIYAGTNIPQDPDTALLSSPFPVYIFENVGVVSHPYPGAVQALLPTDNSYTAAPGCYLACYSHQPGIYKVATDIFVLGQVRVAGKYANRICQPTGYEGKDVSSVATFKQLCSDKIPSCKNIECWAGGDTGGWFGIQ